MFPLLPVMSEDTTAPRAGNASPVLEILVHRREVEPDTVELSAVVRYTETGETLAEVRRVYTPGDPAVSQSAWRRTIAEEARKEVADIWRLLTRLVAEVLPRAVSRLPMRPLTASPGLVRVLLFTLACFGVAGWTLFFLSALGR